MATRKIGVREFRKQIARVLDSDKPVAVTRHGETVGVYVPRPRKEPDPARLAELKAAADRLAEELKDVDEEEFAAEFDRLHRAGRRKARSK